MNLYIIIHILLVSAPGRADLALWMSMSRRLFRSFFEDLLWRFLKLFWRYFWRLSTAMKTRSKNTEEHVNFSWRHIKKFVYWTWTCWYLISALSRITTDAQMCKTLHKLLLYTKSTFQKEQQKLNIFHLKTINLKNCSRNLHLCITLFGNLCTIR